MRADLEFLVYARHDADSVRAELGAPDYSYHFVLESFVPLLARLGTVVRVREPAADLAAHVAAAEARGAIPVYLSFAPPHATHVDAACTTVPVFAWEFATLPEGLDGDDWRADWGAVLRRCGAAITHSGFAADLVRARLGAAFPVVVVPAPVFDRFEPLAAAHAACVPGARRGLPGGALMLDSAAHEFSGHAVVPARTLPPGSRAAGIAPLWTGDSIEVDFAAPRCTAMLVGFYDAENWGVWSRSPRPWLVLPRAVQGQVRLVLRASAHGANAGRPLALQLGSLRTELTLDAAPASYVLEAELDEPASVILFDGLSMARAAVGGDSRTLGIGLASLRIERITREPPAAELAGVMEIGFGAADGPDGLVGFHPAESWGAWSRSSCPWVWLPQPVRGRFALELRASAYGPNVGRTIRLRLGRQQFELQLGASPEIVRIEGVATTAVSLLAFEGIEPVAALEGGDERALGIALHGLRIEAFRGEDAVAATPEQEPAAVAGDDPWVEGCVYVTVLNPTDARKNWGDLLSAFCTTFAREPRATLIVKTVHHDLAQYVERVYQALARLAPFACRVVVVHGFLEESAYRDLVAAADYTVSASRGEGQCLPLMEFMSAGVPAIAPRNTAMQDYLDEACGFPVRSCPEPAHWPHDPRQIFSTLRERIDWQSLADALRASFDVWNHEPERYRALSRAAIEAQRAFCSSEVLTARLQAFFVALPARDVAA
jgi:glycosyltransferase involved in cell wall biosynthesis